MPGQPRCPYCGDIGEVSGFVDDGSFTFTCLCAGGSSAAAAWLLGLAARSWRLWVRQGERGVVFAAIAAVEKGAPLAHVAVPESLDGGVKSILGLTLSDGEWLIGDWVHVDQFQEQAPAWFHGDSWEYDARTGLLRVDFVTLL